MGVCIYSKHRARHSMDCPCDLFYHHLLTKDHALIKTRKTVAITITDLLSVHLLTVTWKACDIHLCHILL